jgi:tetratricopeptide (TPR) repeat protein
MWDKCIDTLIKHLNLKTALWKDERCASMRFIARSYKELKRYDEARMWLDKAIVEAPYLRDPYVERAILEYSLENWEDVEYYCKKALEISTKEKTYINETFSWDYTIYDLLSISCFNLKKYEESLNWVNKAIDMNKNDERLTNNKKIIEEYIKTL